MRENKIQEMIECKCGCGQLRKRYDKDWNERLFILGHQWRVQETKDKIHNSKLGHTVSKEAREKISKAFKGKNYEEIMGEETANRRKKEMKEMFTGEGNPFYNKKHNEETRKIMSEKKQLENHPKWKGVGYMCYYEKIWRKQVRKRDNYVCMVCGLHQEKSKVVLPVHHINYDKTLNVMENGISLCCECHGRIHNTFNRPHWLNFFQSLLKDRYGYSYGLNNEVILTLESNEQPN